MTNIKYILTNKAFTSFENGVKLTELAIHISAGDKFYTHVFGSSLDKFLVGDEFFSDINGEGWVMKGENVNDTNDRWSFLIIHDIEHGWYASHLYTGKPNQRNFDDYKRAKGEAIETTETRVINEIIGELTFFLGHLNVKVKDTRYRILEDKQRIAYKTKQAKEQMDYFYNVVLREKPPEKYKQIFFPDITLFYENKAAEYIEVELTKHSSKENKASFMKKLFKLQGTSRTVYFIFADNNYTHHIKLIREFEEFSTRKFKSLYVCKMSDFKEKGALHAFRDFKRLPTPAKRRKKIG
jgi:hypothetical protein